MCTDNQKEEEVKLSNNEFYTQLEQLLKKAPKGMVYVVNAMEDPESPDPNGRSVIALKGSMAKITYAFQVGFAESPEFKMIINQAVDFLKFKNKMNDMPSMLAELLSRH